MCRRRYILALLFVLGSGLNLISGQPQSPALPNSTAVVAFLNQSISWYRHFSVEEQLATEPRDVLFVNENGQLANQIIRLSFDFANAEAERELTPAGASVGSKGQTDSSNHAHSQLQTMAASADEQANKARTELDSLKAKLEVAKGKRRESLRAAVAEAQSEVNLAETHRDTLQKMAEFLSSATGPGTDTSTLRAQVEQLERTVPAVTAAKNTKGQSGELQATARPTSPTANPKKPSGILGLISDLMALSRKSKDLEYTVQLTNRLASTGKDLRTPFVTALKQAVQQGEQISNQLDSTDAAVLKQQRAQLDTLVTDYKQYSASLLPLSKQRVLLDLYERNLTNWKEAVRAEYRTDLSDLALRLAVLVTALIVVFAFAELWRRAVFRYVHDTKRRYQFLLLRRLVLWFLITLIVAFTFASEIGSFATFAGLLTAGVAVALQNVILSVVGYFLLIGKYGIRVGDRVQIAGVTGEVVEIGLVRLHLLEWEGSGSDAHPTERVVAFPNSVVFQPTGGVFKQIPGTNYVWHEITLTLAPESDFRAVEERLLSAVESVYSEYRERIEGQRKQVEKTIGTAAATLKPESRLRLTKAGLEVVIRYPLELERASAIDDRITREVLDAIQQPPALKLVGTGAPNIQEVA